MINKEDSNKIYFANLDVIRFIAATLVLIFHVEIKKKQFDLPQSFDNFFFRTIGDYAVTIFFVLSGFLITYLLLAEKQKTTTINIPKFYLRRILRIWPLYYLIILIGYFILPHIPALFIPQTSYTWSEFNIGILLLYIFFLPNMAYAILGNVPYIDQTWSIGVEEQYYFLWPFFIKKTRNSILNFCLFILATIILSKTLLYLIDFNLIKMTKRIEVMHTFLVNERFTCMGFGGLGAFIFFNRAKYNNVVEFLLRRRVQLITILLIVYFLVMGIRINNLLIACVLYVYEWFFWKRKYSIIGLVLLLMMFLLSARIPVVLTYSSRVKNFDHEVLAALFCILMINLSNPKTSILNFRSKALLYLGRISYGIYMYHNILIGLSLYLFSKYLNSNWGNILIYSSSLILTIIVSSLSYELYEKHFLKIKKKHMIVKSGA